MTHALTAGHPKANHVASHPIATLLPMLPMLLLALLASGCAGKPTSYYTLAHAPLPLPVPGSVAAAVPAATPILIELTPVIVPERLARPQMVLTKPGQQSAAVELLEQHRWISAFDNELREALATGIAARIGAIDVTRSGAPSAQPVWRIAVQLRQFDAIENVRVDAAFGWSARRSDAEQGAVCRWGGSVAVGSGIDALAKGAQQITDQAAQAIARHVAALALDPAAPCGQ
jgi:uncharacterized lipoprotein YmbA